MRRANWPRLLGLIALCLWMISALAMAAPTRKVTTFQSQVVTEGRQTFLRIEIGMNGPIKDYQVKGDGILNPNRLTIDLDLRFDNHVSGRKTDVGNFVVIELKRDGLCYSPVLEMLLDLRIHPHGFSKYCMGSVMTNSSLRVNRFKRKMIEVEKLTGCRLLNK